MIWGKLHSFTRDKSRAETLSEINKITNLFEGIHPEDVPKGYAKEWSH